ncbi:MAG TPA: PAS domain S-box protein [Salinarimonas sp.]|nr:PAS domain S-box protein [Salinarimonas sp.]
MNDEPLRTEPASIAAARHEREVERLAALARYEILDTPREPAFDDLAALASEICETPIAVVNLVAERRQWFKAEVGLGVRETPLESSFCAHAILESDFLEVPDATKDPRFHRNPLVTGGPGLRFYAGALLKSEEGLPIGTLCVLDTKPRKLTDWQVRSLERLARQATSQLELRLALRSRTESDALYRHIVEGAEDFAIVTLDDNNVVTSWNSGAQRITGYEEAEAVGRSGEIIFTPEDRAAGAHDHEMNRAQSSGRAVDERWHQRKDGSRFWASGLLMRLDQPRGGFLKLFRDRTPEHEAEAALRASEEQLRQKAGEFEALAENVSQLAWMAEPDGHIYWYNKRWYDYTGTTLESMQGWGWRDVHHPERVDGVIREVQANWAKGEPWEGTFLLRGSDGSFRPFLTRAEPIRDQGGRLVRWFGTNTDISGQREAEEALRASEARLRELNETLENQVTERTAQRDRLWRNTQDIQLIIDGQGIFKAVNPAFTSILGWTPDDVLGKPVFDFVIADDERVTNDALQHARVRSLPTVENRYRHKDGGFRWISWVAAPDGELIFASGRHVTGEKEQAEALRNAEEALRQSQKMEAVGQLTGGVAHDFNNLLTIIRSSTDFLRRPDLPEERRDRYVRAIADTVDRAAKLTAQLLAFARRQALKPEVFDVPERVRAITDMVRTIVGPRIELRADISCGTCQVEADLNQFETALVNMAVNARDAMGGEGTLTIRVEHADAMPALRGHAGGPGPFVAVSISDTGEGIPRDRMAQIFDPFFTTKEVGKGTGLGLSQVYGFAKQSGGDVAVDSEVGRGSTFTLYLPRASAGSPIAEPPKVRLEPEHGRGRRVLMVEDNREVGEFSTQLVQDLGYETTWAANAAEALALLDAGQRFDVVFSDVVMPGIDGVELGGEIRRRFPSLPVVLTSGYSHVLAEEGPHGFELLHKPYSAEELSRALHRSAQGRRTGST